MKIYKNLIITFASAILTMLIIYGGYSIYAGEEAVDYYEFTKSKSFSILGIGGAKPTYHKSMNKFFNNKIEKLVGIIDGNEKFFEDENFMTPDDETIEEKGILEACKDNVSTYCAAMQALDLYMAYVATLNSLKGTIPDYSIPTKDVVWGEIKKRDEAVDKEVKDAKLVLEAAIAAYNEFRMAYPMHKKYRDIIKNLMKYRIALKKIRAQTVKFPLRFVDATSSKCE